MWEFWLGFVDLLPFAAIYYLYTQLNQALAAFSDFQDEVLIHIRRLEKRRNQDEADAYRDLVDEHGGFDLGEQESELKKRELI